MPHEKHTPLRRWLWFWLALAIPLFSALTVSVTIIIGDSSIGSFCGASSCWTNFIIFFKVPIAIAGLAIPAVGIAAAIHRSDETAIQIKHSQRQFDEVLANNKFSNYIKHRDSFVALVNSGQDRLLSGQSKARFDASALYEKIYPSNDYTNLEFYSNSEVQFWVVVRSRIEKLLEHGKSFDIKSTNRASFTSDVFIILNQIFDAIELKLENGWSIRGLEMLSNIRCDFVRKADFLSSLQSTINLTFDSVEMLNLISSAECDFDELRSEFNIQWVRALDIAMYAAFQEEI